MQNCVVQTVTNIHSHKYNNHLLFEFHFHVSSQCSRAIDCITWENVCLTQAHFLQLPVGVRSRSRSLLTCSQVPFRPQLVYLKVTIRQWLPMHLNVSMQLHYPPVQQLLPQVDYNAGCGEHNQQFLITAWRAGSFLFSRLQSRRSSKLYFFL